MGVPKSIEDAIQQTIRLHEEAIANSTTYASVKKHYDTGRPLCNFVFNNNTEGIQRLIGTGENGAK